MRAMLESSVSSGPSPCLVILCGPQLLLSDVPDCSGARQVKMVTDKAAFVSLVAECLGALLPLLVCHQVWKVFFLQGEPPETEQ